MKKFSMFSLVLLVLLSLSACGSSSSPGNEDSVGDVLADGSPSDLADEDGIPPNDALFDGKTDVDDDTDVLDVQEDTAEQVQAFIDEGRYWLKNAEPGFAANSFEAALELDEENQDARFGAALSRYVNAIELLNMIVSLPTQLAGYAAGDGTKATDPKVVESENDNIAQLLTETFTDLHSFFQEAEAHFELVDPEGLSWTIEDVPIYFNTREFIVLHGRFDQGDYHLLRASNSFFLWFTGFLAALDMHTDLVTAVATGFEIKDDLSTGAILGLVVFLLDSDSRFLGLDKANGEALFNAGTLQMKAVGTHLLAALDFFENEDSGSEDDVSRYDIDGDNLVIRIQSRLDADSWEEVPIALYFSPDLIQATEDLVGALNSPGTVLPFSRTLGLQLSTVLGVLVQLGFLDHFPLTLPVNLNGLQTEQVWAVLGTYLQDSIGLDYATLFLTPTGLRTFLPMLSGSGLAEGSLPFEWECPEEIAENGAPLKLAGFVCSIAATLTDAPHFVDTPYEIEADSYPSALPYMIWEDPTLASLVQVDVAFNIDDPDFVQPNLQELNWGIHTFLSGFMGLLR
mgnify:CR=1 FL=1